MKVENFTAIVIEIQPKTQDLLNYLIPSDPTYIHISLSKSNAVANTSKSVAHFPILIHPILFTQSITFM